MQRGYVYLCLAKDTIKIFDFCFKRQSSAVQGKRLHQIQL